MEDRGIHTAVVKQPTAALNYRRITVRVPAVEPNTYRPTVMPVSH